METNEKLIERTYKELIGTAEKLNYVVKFVDGTGGLCYFWEGVIEVGRDSSPRLRVITLAHELGHAIDHKENMVSAEELVTIVKLPDYYSTSKIYYDREKAAWSAGKELLKNIGSYEFFRDDYVAERKRCLQSYYYRMIKAQKDGTDTPTTEEYLKAYKEVLSLVGKATTNEESSGSS